VELDFLCRGILSLEVRCKIWYMFLLIYCIMNGRSV